MINRIRNYNYINRELQTPEAPPIIQHKDNISQLTIYNTGWSEGYTAGYIDGRESVGIWNKITLLTLTIIGISIGLSIGIWL